MIKVTNISDRAVYIGMIVLKPLESYIFENGLTDRQKNKVETLSNLNLIQIVKVDKVITKKKNKK